MVSANQCQRKSQLPAWITGAMGGKDQVVRASGGAPAPALARRRKSVATKENNEIALPATLTKEKNESATLVNGDGAGGSAVSEPEGDEYVSRGGSCIVGPLGEFAREPVWENSDELVVAEVDFEDCTRGKLDFDVAGHYSRSDQFHLSVAGLDLVPPP